MIMPRLNVVAIAAIVIALCEIMQTCQQRQIIHEYQACVAAPQEAEPTPSVEDSPPGLPDHFRQMLLHQ